MQIVYSLLVLQANSTDDIRLQAALKESQDRVYAMSALHETLYQSNNVSNIELKSYLTKISKSLIQSSNINPDQVQMSVLCNDIHIKIRSASALGLVVNELISNSFKHAFPDSRKGEIKMMAKKQNNDLILTITDDGIGFPPDFDWEKSSKLGMKLVHSLVEKQLQGSIDFDGTYGSEFTVKLDLNRINS